jgi:MSHA biogenesis protein MshK
MKALTAVAGTLLVAFAASAAPFADPTRPPTPSENVLGSAGSTEGPRLESVLIAPDRRIAVVNGQQVVVGARIAGGEVVRITESEVVIRGAGSEQTLKLVPGIGRTPAKKGRGQ